MIIMKKVANINAQTGDPHVREYLVSGRAGWVRPSEDFYRLSNLLVKEKVYM